jgi:hypothetical protein
MNDRPELIADLLMGAAYADKHLDGRELTQVKKLLCDLLNEPKLPSALEKRLTDFEPIKLNVTATVNSIGLSNADEKRKLLELIAAVHDADEVWDFDEDLYLRGVAAALGVSDEAISDLTIGDLQIDVIGDALLPPALPPKPSSPPPMPGKE